MAVPHQGELVPEGLPHPLHVSVSPAECVLVLYPLTQEGHVMAKESQVRPLIFILLENKLNDIICRHLSGSDDATMLTVASRCLYLLVKGGD